MKKSLLLIAFLLISSVSFLGCKKNKDEDKLTTAATDFTFTTDNRGGVLITVNNPDKNAHYTFEFGDGNYISTETFNYENAFLVDGADEYTRKYYFKTNGTYTVKVTVEDVNRGSASSNNTITISTVPTKAKITYFKLKDYPTLNPSNNGNWDTDASGPDITFSYTNYFDSGGPVGNSYINASKAILPLQLNVDTLSFSVNTVSVGLGCYDNDAPSTNEGITSLNLVIKENTAQGAPYFLGGNNEIMYPTILSNDYLEIGIDWIQ